MNTTAVKAAAGELVSAWKEEDSEFGRLTRLFTTPELDTKDHPERNVWFNEFITRLTNEIPELRAAADRILELGPKALQALAELDLR